MNTNPEAVGAPLKAHEVESVLTLLSVVDEIGFLTREGGPLDPLLAKQRKRGLQALTLGVIATLMAVIMTIPVFAGLCGGCAFIAFVEANRAAKCVRGIDNSRAIYGRLQAKLSSLGLVNKTPVAA